MTLSEAHEAYWKGIEGYLRKTFHDADLAEDAAQQAFSKAVFALPYIRDMPGEAVRAWLRATAYNAAIDMLRKRKRLAYGYDFDAIEGRAQADTADMMALRESIARLKQELQLIVQMRYYQEMNATQIGKAIGMNASTVRYHLKSALSQLKTDIEEEDP